MNHVALCRAVVVAALSAGTILGQQIPTGTLTGQVLDGKLPLPGVTITLTSRNQQGARVAYSTVNGDYILELLPPGPYAVRFELDGFQTIETTVNILGDLTSRVDAAMPRVTRVTEEVTVAGTHDTISTSATNATTYESKLIQALPVSRDVSGYVGLAPGTVALSNDVYYWVQIAGAAASDSLYLVNGAAASENVVGGFIPLYIEDAIQETTISLANVSAEYGRFTGGVVNALTKSGGNEFHGSLRLELSNPKWTAPTPLTTKRADQLGKLWEGTLGGYVMRDKLWFFLAGRTASETTSLQTYPPVSIPVDQSLTENRYEGKLTLSLTPSHRLVGSYLDRERRWTNYYYQWSPTYDLDSFYPLSRPEDIEVLNYSGVLSNSFFLEGQASARHLTRRNEGSRYTDVERGTPVVDMSNNWAIYNSPVYCAVCPGQPQRRDNSDVFAKASVFLSTKRAGSHDLRFGVDLYDDIWRANNWQSGTGYFVYASSVSIVGSGTNARYYPMFVPGQSFIVYFPIFELSKGSHFKTKSAFVNDVWRLRNFTFSAGVRFDKNDGTDQSGAKVVKDSKLSPRLSATWDPKGDGATLVTLSYGEYVAGIQNSIANLGAAGGSPANLGLDYEGPPINAERNDVETHEALRQVFAWLDSIGGVMANPQLWLWAYLPGYQVFIGDHLKSPSTTEWTAGIARHLGDRGLVRLDYVNKTWHDFYAQRLDLTTGTSEDPLGNVYNRDVIGNDNTTIQRTYWGWLLQGEYRFGDRLRLGGNYTYSKLYGNDILGTQTDWATDSFSYPEYHDLRWYTPLGCLAGDHRHKADVYTSWDAVSTRAFGWNISVLQRYLSGSPYGAASGWVMVRPYVTNPGYITPPRYTWYALTAPDAYRSDAVSSTDLAMTFTFKVAGIELYVNPRVTNLFNRHAVINPNSTAYVAFDLPDNLAPFNPFTEKPKECPQGTTCDLADGYNWQKGPDFGKAVQPTDYQTPRTFLLNVGVRF